MYQSRVWKILCFIQVFFTTCVRCVDTLMPRILWRWGCALAFDMWGRCSNKNLVVNRSSSGGRAHGPRGLVIGAISSAGTPGVHVWSVCFRLQLPNTLLLKTLSPFRFSHISIPLWLAPQVAQSSRLGHRVGNLYILQRRSIDNPKGKSFRPASQPWHSDWCNSKRCFLSSPFFIISLATITSCNLIFRRDVNSFVTAMMEPDQKFQCHGSVPSRIGAYHRMESSSSGPAVNPASI